MQTYPQTMPYNCERLERAWHIVRQKLKRMNAQGKPWQFTQVDNKLCFTQDPRLTPDDIETIEEAYLIFFKGQIPASLEHA